MKKNKITKILVAITVTALLAMTFTLTAYATGEPIESTSVADDTSLPRDESIDAGIDSSVIESDGNESIFGLMYKTAMSYSSEIFCALACACSLILAFAYKKGLLPLIKAALSALTGSVTKLREQTEAHLDGSDSVLSKVKDALVTYEEKAEALTEKLCAMDEKLTELEKSGNTAKATEYIMNAQIDMLYELFMASGIPQFQKEAVAEKVKIMKEAVKTNEGGKESE